MAISNRDRVGSGIDLLCHELVPYMERELQVAYSEQWSKVAKAAGMGETRLNRDPLTPIPMPWLCSEPSPMSGSQS
jgi:hypothetical protein